MPASDKAAFDTIDYSSAKKATAQDKSRPTVSSGGYSQSRAQISATSSTNKSTPSSAGRYVSTGSNNKSKPSSSDRYVSTGSNNKSKSSSSDRYVSGGSNAPSSNNPRGVNPPSSRTYVFPTPSGRAPRPVSLGFGNTGTSTRGIDALMNRASPVAQKMLGIPGPQAAVDAVGYGQGPTLARDALTGTGNSQIDFLRDRWGSFPRDGFVFGGGSPSPVPPMIPQTGFEEPPTAGPPDRLVRRARRPGFVPEDMSGGWPNSPGPHRSDTSDIGPGFGLAGTGRPAVIPTDTATMDPNDVRKAIEMGITTANAGEANTAASDLSVPVNASGLEYMMLPGPIPTSEHLKTPEDAALAAQILANQGKQGSLPPGVTIFDRNAPIIDMTQPEPEVAADAPTFYPDVATGGLGFGPEFTGDPNEVAPYYVGSGPSEGYTLEQFRDALVQVESGNRYDAKGAVIQKSGDRAWGKYQVMGANIPDWTEQHYGTRLTPQQFLETPEAQDAVWTGQMGEYYARSTGTPEERIRNASSLWFTGKPYSPATADLSDRQVDASGKVTYSGITNKTYGDRVLAHLESQNGVLSTGDHRPGGMVNPAPGQFVSPQGSGGLSFGIPEADLATSMVRGYPVGNASGGTPTAPASGAPAVAPAPAPAAPSVADEFNESYESRKDIPRWANTIAGAVNPLFGLAGMGINAMGGIPLGDPNNPAERYVSSAQRPHGDSRRDRRGFGEGEGEGTDDGGTPPIPDDAPPWWPPGVPWPPVAPAPAPGPVVPPYVPSPTPVVPSSYYFSHPDVNAAAAAGLAGIPGAPWQ